MYYLETYDNANYDQLQGDRVRETSGNSENQQHQFTIQQHGSSEDVNLVPSLVEFANNNGQYNNLQEIQRQQSLVDDHQSMFQNSIFVNDNDDNRKRKRNSINSDSYSESESSQNPKQQTSKKRMSLAERNKQKLDKLKSGHQVRAACSCRMQCSEKISESRRQSINQQYWDMIEIDRNTFVLYSSERMLAMNDRVLLPCRSNSNLNPTSNSSEPNTTTANLNAVKDEEDQDDDQEEPEEEESDSNAKSSKKGMKKSNSFKYFLKDENDVRYRVCKRFFLTTLGYKSTNDSVLYNVLSRKTPKGQLRPTPSLRGKKSCPVNKFLHSDLVYSHIDSFNPSMPKYRKKHAPNVAGYLPSTLNAYGMFRDFQRKYPEIKLSSTLYSRHLKDKKISFTSNKDYTNGPSYKDTEDESQEPDLDQSEPDIQTTTDNKKGSGQKSTKTADERLKKTASEHPLIAPCSCRSRCLQKIPQTRRESIHSQFWAMHENDRNAYILYSCDRIMGDKSSATYFGDECNEPMQQGNSSKPATNKKNGSRMSGSEPDSRRKDNLYKYYFRDGNDFRHRVCKQFFLTTLGYQPRNDTVLNTVLAKTPKGQLRPNPSMRGKAARPNPEYLELIEYHIKTFEPRLPDYLHRKAPNIRGYLPRNLTVRALYKDFKLRHPGPCKKVAYDTYRRHFKNFKYSFLPMTTRERNEAKIRAREKLRERNILNYTATTPTKESTTTNQEFENETVPLSLAESQAVLDNFDPESSVVPASLPTSSILETAIASAMVFGDENQNHQQHHNQSSFEQC